MKEHTKIDKDYMEALNLGYELARELNLTSPMVKGLNSDNIRMKAIQAGMALSISEIKQEKNRGIELNLDSDNYKLNSNRMNSSKSENKNENKGLNRFI